MREGTGGREGLANQYADLMEQSTDSSLNGSFHAIKQQLIECSKKLATGLTLNMLTSPCLFVSVGIFS